MKELTGKRKTVYFIVAVGFMSALVYLGNYLQIKIPNGLLTTRIHLGNSMCLLAGLLFGPLAGGLSSGIGAMFYDLFDPTYIVSAPYTFISKFAMGFAAGLLNRLLREKKDTAAAAEQANGHTGRDLTAAITAGIIGQIVYIVLYLLKSFLSILILGGTTQEAWAAVAVNSVTSSINAVFAVLISVPLYFSIRAALRSTEFGALMNKKITLKMPKPVPAFLTVLVIAGAIYGTINLSTVKKAAEQKAAAQQVQETETSTTTK